ncbi:MAG: hypothetical protein HS099_00515 [Ardenticatenaceae bacterium]|nr:hypothetical protein [Ardenticatenaceae bacterium]
MLTMVAYRSSPEHNLTTQDLLLPLEALPSTWEISGSPRPMGPGIGFGDEDDTYISFKLKSDKYNIAYQFMLHYPNIRQAEKGYLDLHRSHFNDNSIAVDVPWQTPAELSYTSSYADQFRIACTINNVAGPKQVCQVMGQYGQYVLIFHSVIRPDTMSLSEFNGVAQFLDEMMVKKLALPSGEWSSGFAVAGRTPPRHIPLPLLGRGLPGWCGRCPHRATCVCRSPACLPTAVALHFVRHHFLVFHLRQSNG